MAIAGASSKQVVVVGAGFSGLVAAWSLQRQGFSVTIIEKSARAGGLIHSFAHPLGLIETAANGLLASALVEELFADCGIKIQQPKKSARRRYLAVEGRVSRFPLTLTEAFLLARRALSARKNPPFARENLDSWATRTFGRAVAAKIVGPAMLGVYASEATDLSAKLIVGRFYDRARLRRTKGRLRGTVSAPGGMGALLSALREKLESRGASFLDSDEVSIPASPKETNSVDVLALGFPVVLATSAWNAADFLRVHRPGDSRLPALESIRSIPLMSVTLFFRTQPTRLGFGTLFAQTPPDGERDGILGCLQNSEIFEGRARAGVHSETWIVGGAQVGEKMISLSDDDLVTRILEKRDRLIDARSRENLLDVKITRWPRAIPHYSTELETKTEGLLKTEGNITLFGNYLGELGLASILEMTRDLEQRIRGRG